MRFCMVTTFYPPYNFGGDGIFVQRLSNELARRGHHVEVVHCVDSYLLLAGRAPQAAEEPEHPNVTVHRLKSPFGFLSPLATQQVGRPWFKAGRLREILAQDFDVINYHNISLVGGPQILEHGRGLKLYTLHEYWLVCPTHTLFRYNRAPCTDPHCFTCSLAHKRPPQWWRYTRLLQNAIKHVDMFLSPSPFAQQIHHKMGLDIPVTALPFFAPDAPSEAGQAEAAQLSPAGQQPYFLYVGRLEKIKGLHTLLPVFHRYPKARLLIAGEGHDEPWLRRLAGNAENIQFLGRLSHAQLQPLYRQATAVIVPSICYEVSPLVIFEAFLQETPVIVRNLGGMPLIVHDSGGGLVFEDDASLVAAMDRLLAEPGLRDKLGQRAYRMYTSRLTPDAHVEAYLQVIARLREARRAQGARRELPTVQEAT